MLITETFDQSNQEIKEKDLEESENGSKTHILSDLDDQLRTEDQQSVADTDEDQVSLEDHNLQMAIAAEEDLGFI